MTACALCKGAAPSATIGVLRSVVSVVRMALDEQSEVRELGESGQRGLLNSLCAKHLDVVEEVSLGVVAMARAKKGGSDG